MTVNKLIEEYKKHNPCGHFFDADTLAFFGERICEMRVLKETEKIVDKYGDGEEHECYMLSSYQRKHPCGARRAYHYFDVNTFENI